MDALKKLAINGGSKAVPSLPGRFHFGKEEKAAVDALFDKAIESGKAPGYNGEQEDAFCKEFADFLGGGYVDGVNSGTTAVHVALKALELPAFSEVVFGCVTDAGGVMPIVENNCIPVPADTTEDSFNTGVEQIEARITERTSAIIVAHVAGEPADIPAILKMAAKYNLPVIEDCAQAHMAKINGQNVGTMGTLGAYSLMFGKHMCTGGQGGAVFTKDEDMYWKVRRAADRGKPFGLTDVWAQDNMRYSLNYNMDEIHAAIGREQLKKLPWLVNKRLEAVDYLRKNGLNELKGISFPTDNIPEGFESCCWWYRFRVEADRITCTIPEYIDALLAEGVHGAKTYRYMLPMLKSWYNDHANMFPWNNPCYKGDPNAVYDCPNSLRNMDRDFPLYVTEGYQREHLDMVIEAFKKVDAAYAK